MPRGAPSKRPTNEDVRHLFRTLSDHAVARILALEPTHAQLEEAAAKVTIGDEEIFANRGSEDAVVKAIVDIAASELDQEDEPPPTAA
jgi:hypothetical protein